MATIGLALIAKNEEKTIGRLLRSCENWFDEVVLVDTGSTDKTKEEFLNNVRVNNRNYGIVDFEWTDDFAAARNFAQSQLTTDWVVWADCDDVLKGWNEKIIELLDSTDATFIKCPYEYHPGYTTYRERFVRRGYGVWRGSIHEYQEISGTSVTSEFPTWLHLPGGDHSRQEKDLEILEGVVEKNPDDSRAQFYLAQTAYDLGHFGTAVDAYKKRLTQQGFFEERYYSYYRLGLISHFEEYNTQALYYLNQAWQICPNRLEAPYWIAKINRIIGHHQQAYAITSLMLKDFVPEPGWEVGATLFVEDWIEKWGAKFEHSLNAYYTYRYADAFTLNRELLEIPDLPDDYRDQVEKNQEFVAGKL